MQSSTKVSCLFGFLFFFSIVCGDFLSLFAGLFLLLLFLGFFCLVVVIVVVVYFKPVLLISCNSP